MIPFRPPSRLSAAASFVLMSILAGTLFMAGGTEHGAAAEETSLEDAQQSAEVFDRIGDYLSLPVPDSSEVEAALDSLDGALEEWSDGNHLAGAERADLALATLPALSDWRPLIRAELLAPTGDTAAVRAALEAIDPSTDLRSRWGWAFLVDAYEEADDEPGAWRAAEEAAQAPWIGTSESAAWFRAGRLALASGDSIGAEAALNRSIRVGGESDSDARRAALLLDDLSDPEHRDDRLSLGRLLLAVGSWERAQRRLAPLLEDTSLPELVEAEIRLGLGRGLVELAQTREAEVMLAPISGEATPADWAGPALHWMGRAALARGETSLAEERFLAVARRIPGSALAEEGLLLHVEHVSARGGPAATRRAMEALLDTGVGSATGELVAVRLGSQLYLSGDYDRAALTFERYLEGGRRSVGRQQAAYWAALAHERRGDPARARSFLAAAHEENPLSFYGTVAGDRIGAPVLPPGLNEGPLPQPGVADQLANAVIRLQVHQRVPTAGSFNHELERLEEYFFHQGTAAYDFSERLLESGLPIQSVVLGREIHAREGEWNLRLLRLVHPFPYREIIVREARARGLDPFFVAGLIRQESLFHPTIQSSAGAVGLMQLLPSTAQEVARSESLRFSTASLGDPEYNVRLGTAFLANMVRRFEGSAEDALSAYNAGPTRARQWQSRAEYRDTDVFIEHIPFAETRHYVKVVQQYTRIYTALYGCGDFEPCEGLSYRAAVEQSPTAGGAPASLLAR
ncbi:MAG: lytic transglycosylase domain-containing protein [Gemmatimonadota bacterium]